MAGRRAAVCAAPINVVQSRQLAGRSAGVVGSGGLMLDRLVRSRLDDDHPDSDIESIECLTITLLNTFPRDYKNGECALVRVTCDSLRVVHDAANMACIGNTDINLERGDMLLLVPLETKWSACAMRGIPGDFVHPRDVSNEGCVGFEFVTEGV